MELNLLIIGFVFLLSGFLVGVKKYTWLLAGCNEKRVGDKEKLARLVGVGLLICGFIGLKEVETIMMVAVGIILLEVVYVNVKLVE